MPDNTFSIKFQGYSDSTTHASEIIPSQQNPAWKCPTFANMRQREGKAIQRFGETPVGKGPYLDVQMHWWVRLLNQEYRLVVTSGSVVDDITGPLTGGANRFTPGIECNAAWINGLVVIGNGIDPNVRFDGRTVARLTVEPANASGTVLTAGAAGNPNGTYQYAVKFLNADGIEGDIVGLGTINPGLSPVITVATLQILLSNLPVCPAGQDCSGLNLYRTKDGGVVNGVGSAFFFVATLANGTTTYTDNLADDALGLPMLNLSSPNTPFPPCRYFQEHLGRLLGAGCFTTDSNPYTLHVSDNLDPTTCRLVTDNPDDPANAYQGLRVQLASRSAGQITALSESFGATVLVFTGGQMFVWTGTDLTSFELYPLAMHGCTAHRTLAQYENLLVWLAADGLYTYLGSQYATYLGQAFKKISEDVKNTILGMSASDMASASAVVSDGRYYLFWPAGRLVYDFLYGSLFYTDGPNRFGLATGTLYTADHRSRIYAVYQGTATQPSSQATVWQLETGLTDNGNPIPCRLRSPDFQVAGPQMQARVIRCGGTFRTASEILSGSLIRGTSQTIQSWVLPLASGSTGIVPFDVTVSPLSISRMRQKANAQAISDWLALSFACDSTSGLFEVIDGMIEWEPGGGVNG